MQMKYSEPNKFGSASTISEVDYDKEIFPMSDIKTSFNKAKRKAGLDTEITFHCLRHTFCSVALDFMNINTVKKLAGHSDLRTTQQYLHTNKKQVVEEHANFANSISARNIPSSG